MPQAGDSAGGEHMTDPYDPTGPSAALPGRGPSQPWSTPTVLMADTLPPVAMRRRRPGARGIGWVAAIAAVAAGSFLAYHNWHLIAPSGSALPTAEAAAAPSPAPEASILTGRDSAASTAATTPILPQEAASAQSDDTSDEVAGIGGSKEKAMSEIAAAEPEAGAAAGIVAQGPSATPDPAKQVRVRAGETIRRRAAAATAALDRQQRRERAAAATAQLDRQRRREEAAAATAALDARPRH